jgi:hypothetical protein
VTHKSTNKKSRRGMSAHVAARLALRFAIHHAIADVVENEGPDYAREEYATARQWIEAAVRRERDAPVRDIKHLRDTVAKAVPQSHRDKALNALAHLEDALDENRMVAQDITYFIGVAVGQALRGSDSWDVVSLRDAFPSWWLRRRRKRR